MRVLLQAWLVCSAPHFLTAALVRHVAGLALPAGGFANCDSITVGAEEA